LIRVPREFTLVTETDLDAVFWDIGGVIVRLETIQAGHKEFVESLLAEHDSPLSVADALDTWRSELGEYFRGGEGTEYRTAREGYAVAVDAILDDDADEVEWEPLFKRIHDEHARPHDGAAETIAALAETDRHLGVISDVDHDEGKRLLDNFGVLEHFDAFTSSEEVGYKKPDPRIFTTALEKAGVDGEDGLMIGDRYRNDMEGAKDAEMTTVSYGAEDGPAVDHQITDLREVLTVVGVDR
jgi:putative hydrolase of the HAD superfamily